MNKNTPDFFLQNRHNKSKVLSFLLQNRKKQISKFFREMGIAKFGIMF